MSVISMKQLLEAGVHFGHQTRRWNPKMAEYIYTETPDGLLSMLAFAIFSIFGVYTLYQGLKLVRASVCPIPVIPVLVVMTIVFAGLCAFLFVRREKKKKAA